MCVGSQAGATQVSPQSPLAGGGGPRTQRHPQGWRFRSLPHHLRTWPTSGNEATTLVVAASCQALRQEGPRKSAGRRRGWQVTTLKRRRQAEPGKGPLKQLITGWRNLWEAAQSRHTS